MDTPKMVQKSPYELHVTKGKRYAWCACGLSKSQPLCDGAHAGTGMAPHVFTASETRNIWLCGCKHSKESPYCDGSHSALE